MDNNGRSRRRKLPLSISELRQRCDDAVKQENKVVFVPRLGRSSPPAHNSADSDKASAGADQAASAKRTRSPSTTDNRYGESERAAIRRHYMREHEHDSAGLHRVSRTTGEKYRFKFDWDSEEDTTAAADADESFSQLLSQSHAAFARSRRRRPGVAEFDRSAAHVAPRGRGRERSQPALQNACHWSQKGREEMTARDWAIFREDYAITMRGGSGELTRPARNWEETGLPDDLLQLVLSAGYKEPTPIQMCAIPVGLRCQDLIGLAETGSGKTAAFVLPLLVYIRGLPKLSSRIASNGPYALVLAPTRELVLQIELETRKFATPLGYRVTAVIGGQGLEQQGLALQSGCEIVVCTPGRMVDLLSRQLAVLGNCYYLILDEADRMIDMGFEPQVQDILAAMPDVQLKETESSSSKFEALKKRAQTSRQTVMFSATMSPTVERLARDYLVKPLVLTIGETGKASDTVDQRVEFLTSEGKKRERLVNLVRILESPVIVFVNTKKGCEDVSRLLESSCGLRSSVLHSGKSQEQREQILSGFKAGRVGVLVATDLLGRGIDIKGVNHVVNFELPTEMSKYTHRIGRTGRAGRKGIAWSLATSADSDIFDELKAYLEQSGSRVCPALARHNAGRHTLRHIVD